VSDKETSTEVYIARQNQENPIQPETFRVSGDMITISLIALVFLAAGIFMGLVIAGFGTNTQQIRTIVEETVSSALDTRLTALEAVIASSGGSDISAEELSALVQSALEDASRVQNFRADDDPFIGVADAPIVIVEFSDFYCSFCGRHYQQTLTPLIENYDGLVKYVYRDFPTVGGDAAQLTGMAAECADDQGKFWEYHNALFDKQDDLRAATTDADALRNYLVTVANNLELDVDSFSSCYDNQTHLNDVISDATDAQTVGARGTPAFLINGQFVSGAQSYEYFANIINAKLEELGIEPPQQG